MFANQSIQNEPLRKEKKSMAPSDSSDMLNIKKLKNIRDGAKLKSSR
jgi:hypothetical protein